MSLLSRIRRDVNAAERTAQKTSARDVARKAKRQAQELKRKAKQDAKRAGQAADRAKREAPKKARADARRAEEQARREKDELKRKVRQDIRTAGRMGITGIASGATSAARSAAAGVEFEDQGVDAPESTAEVVQRAGAAASVRSPMNASLDPGTNGAALELFASATPMTGQSAGQQRSEASQGRESGDGEPLLGDGFIAGGDPDDTGVAVAVDVTGDMGGLESQFFGGEE